MVQRSNKLAGLDKVIAKLNTEVSKIEGRTLKGLIRAAIIVRRDMDKVSPKIPVDTGNLRQSFFIINFPYCIDTCHETKACRFFIAGCAVYLSCQK